MKNPMLFINQPTKMIGKTKRNKLMVMLCLFWGIGLFTVLTESCDNDEDVETNLLGVWELQESSLGWEGSFHIKTGESLSIFKEDGTLEVKSIAKHDYDAYFKPSGIYAYTMMGKDSLAIEGKAFAYRIDGKKLCIYDNVEADGPFYQFVKVKERPW